MKRFSVVLGLAALLAVAAPAQAVRLDVVGEIVATTGSAANVGDGSVKGFLEFQDPPLFSVPGSDFFDLVGFELDFGGALTAVTGDALFATVEIESTSGRLLSLDLDARGLTGLGLGVAVDLRFGSFDTAFQFTDPTSSVVAEGSIRLAPTVSVDEPMVPLAALALTLVATGWRRRGR
ncbi:MAG: hypothetical protein H6983_14410 [Ectothiorhodospiraceae bacterium]|nr:hypothetical protein [Ectothiorhodospiraceae bacterium]